MSEIRASDEIQIRRGDAGPLRYAEPGHYRVRYLADGQIVLQPIRRIRRRDVIEANERIFHGGRPGRPQGEANA